MINYPSFPYGSASLKQRGLSLVELMITLIIALFMIAAIYAIYFPLKNTYTAQDKLSQLQDSERLVLTMMTNTVQQAGYFPDPHSSNAAKDVFLATALNQEPAFAVEQVVTGINGGINASDSISVRYQSNSGDGLMDCTGKSNNSGSEVEYVNTFAVNTDHEMTCTVKRPDNSSDGAVVLAPNVYSLKVLYGVDRPQEGIQGGSINTWLAADQVNNWNKVRSVQVKIKFIDTVNSTANNIKPMPQELVQTINLMNRIE